MTTDELRIILRINGAATYTHTINEVTNVTNNYNKSCGNLISTLAKLVSAGAIVRFGKQCIQAASELQEVANVVDVTFGKSADTVNKWAKSQAANFGLSETAAKRYVGTYGTMAKQFGMTSTQAAQMGIELTKLTGDVASFYNIDSKAAQLKLKSIFTGETESLKELGVVMTQTQLDAYAMSIGLGKTTKQMSEEEKVLLRYQFTLDKLSHAQGDFARTSDSYANSTRSLSLELENLKIEVGKELLPVVAMGVQAISKTIQALSPILVNVARTIRYYAEAWKNASETTKTFAKLAIAAFGVMIIAPKVIAAVRAAVRLLTMEVSALNAALGVLGFIFAALAFKGLSDSVSEMRSATSEVDNLGESASVSSDDVEELSDSLDGLSDSAKGLDTFLASFDEVNKVGGGSSLMSNLVTTDDLSNILGAASGIEDLQESMNSISVPDITSGTIFDGNWWKEKGRMIKDFVTGYIKDIFKGNLWEDWMTGAESFDAWLKEHFPVWESMFTQLGAEIYDLTHHNADTDNSEWLGGNGEEFTFVSPVTGKTRTALKYNSDGTETDLYKKYGSNVSPASTATYNNKTVTTTTTTAVYQPNIMIDGRKITAAVVNGINDITRSTGQSPLVEMGG